MFTVNFRKFHLLKVPFSQELRKKLKTNITCIAAMSGSPDLGVIRLLLTPISRDASAHASYV